MTPEALKKIFDYHRNPRGSNECAAGVFIDRGPCKRCKQTGNGTCGGWISDVTNHLPLLLDHITALTAETVHLKTQCTKWHDEHDVVLLRAEAAEAEITRLREALDVVRREVGSQECELADGSVGTINDLIDAAQQEPKP
jgi:hypothetical protein